MTRTRRNSGDGGAVDAPEETPADAAAAAEPAERREQAAPDAGETTGSADAGGGGDDEAQDAGADELMQEVENLRREVETFRDRSLRAQAELENLRKRAERDVENAHKYALDRFVNDLLPVIDSMELGIDASTSADDIEGLRQGMDLTLKQFVDTLGRFGVRQIDPRGEKFNPERHEAVTMQEMDGAESGTVITVLQKGYELNGRLVRPAMVVVAK